MRRWVIIGMNQPTDDTPSVSPSGCQLPQRGSLDGAFPGSLSEGAVERSETEGVYFDERNRSKISEFIMAGG